MKNTKSVLLFLIELINDPVPLLIHRLSRLPVSEKDSLDLKDLCCFC